MKFDPMPSPGPGARVFSGIRKVRLGDVDRRGILRLDGLTRFSQDVSNDDTNDAGLEENLTWVVRRTVVEVRSEAVFGETLTIATFCSGIGSRWADRRLSVTGSVGAAYEISTLWIFIDETGTPRRLDSQFMEIWGPGITNHRVSARLTNPKPTETALAHPWTLRAVDFDTLDHVNNAGYWAVVEEVRDGDKAHFKTPYRAELEYGTGIPPGAIVEYLTDDVSGSLGIWWLSDGDYVASAWVSPS